MNWHPFGSALVTRSCNRFTIGRNCQRDGTVYRYGFDSLTGEVRCYIFDNGIRVR